MKFTIETKPTAASLKHVDVILLPVWLDSKGKPEVWGELFSLLSKADQLLLQNYAASRQRKAGESKLIRLNNIPAFAFVAIENDFTEKKLVLLARRFIRTAKVEGFKVAAIYVDDFERNNVNAERMCALVSGNALYAHYDFSEQFKTPPADGWKRVETVMLATHHEAKKCSEMVKVGEIMAESLNECRTLSNFPPSDLKPEGMAEAARTVTNAAGPAKGGNGSIKVTVFDEKRLKQEGMNAILAVGQGSASKPCLVIMEYSGGKKTERPIAFIGKGVTFDSGGLNLKPGSSMAEMHMDMSGGAAVIYAIKAIAALKIPINIIGLIPAVENMVSGFSYRQGDIVKAYGGKTIEIGNTDAEGRVILADAIEYAKTKKPELIVTLATLTGAAMVALGTRFSGLFVKNNKKLQDALEKIGDECDDRVWPLPLTEEFEKDVEGNLADVINTDRTNTRWGGASHGAAFLSHFAKGANFAHIDMAPRMTTNPEEEQLSKGAAGFGVRYFVTLAMKWAEVRETLG